MNAYESLVRRLYQVNMWNPTKLGLETSERLHALTGHPLTKRTTPIVHVAGTNGKGSVSWKVAQVLRLSGLKTGLFVSPHISSFRERVQVNGELISENDVAAGLSKVLNRWTVMQMIM